MAVPATHSFLSLTVEYTEVYVCVSACEEAIWRNLSDLVKDR